MYSTAMRAETEEHLLELPSDWETRFHVLKMNWSQLGYEANMRLLAFSRQERDSCHLEDCSNRLRAVSEYNQLKQDLASCTANEESDCEHGTSHRQSSSAHNICNRRKQKQSSNSYSESHSLQRAREEYDCVSPKLPASYIGQDIGPKFNICGQQVREYMRVNKEPRCDSPMLRQSYNYNYLDPNFNVCARKEVEDRPDSCREGPSFLQKSEKEAAVKHQCSCHRYPERKERHAEHDSRPSQHECRGYDCEGPELNICARTRPYTESCVNHEQTKLKPGSHLLLKISCKANKARDDSHTCSYKLPTQWSDEKFEQPRECETRKQQCHQSAQCSVDSSRRSVDCGEQKCNVCCSKITVHDEETESSDDNIEIIIKGGVSIEIKTLKEDLRKIDENIALYHNLAQFANSNSFPGRSDTSEYKYKSHSSAKGNNPEVVISTKGEEIKEEIQNLQETEEERKRMHCTQAESSHYSEIPEGMYVQDSKVGYSTNTSGGHTYGEKSLYEEVGDQHSSSLGGSEVTSEKRVVLKDVHKSQVVESVEEHSRAAAEAKKPESHSAKSTEEVLCCSGLRDQQKIIQKYFVRL